MSRASVLTVLGSIVMLAACSGLQPDRIDYKSAAKANNLEVPPDLTALSRDSRYSVSGGAVSLASGSAAGGSAVVPTAMNTLRDIRMERSGNQRWLVVDRPADQLWGPVRDFWKDTGFQLTIDEQNIGVMETDWAENRANIQQDLIRRTVGKLFDRLYDSGERDKFRTRLERNASSTEIYITHRGLAERLIGGTNGRNPDTTRWESRPADPELETELLRRLMVRLGSTQEAANTSAAAATPIKTSSRVVKANGQSILQIDDDFDRAWRRVGVSLDRSGFTVEDRDRSSGVYFVRYVEPKAESKETGFFAKLFSNNDQPPVKFRIALKSEGGSTTVTFLDDKGATAPAVSAQRIAQALADDLK